MPHRTASGRSQRAFAPTHFVAGKLASEWGRSVDVLETPFFDEVGEGAGPGEELPEDPSPLQ